MQGLVKTQRQGWLSCLPGFWPLWLVYLVFVSVNGDFIRPLLTAWWASHEASQGLLILPVSLCLIVRQLLARRSYELTPSGFWLGVFIASSAGIHLGGLLSIQLIVFSALIVAFMAIPLALYGVDRFGRWGSVESYFPPFYSLLALPFWEFSNSLFQLGSLKATEFFLGLSPITHYVEGFKIELASGVFFVDAGCSGLRFMVSAVAIATLYAFLYFKTHAVRAVCIVSLLALALVGNWIRIIVIVIIGYATDMQSPLIQDHGTFGWVIFAVLLAGWIFFMNRLERD